jgi:hypothetical protein
MNCAEFQEVLPEMLEGGRSGEQDSHRKSCSGCAALVADLELISQEARFLCESAEPSPRVWNSIAIALQQEGLIRQPQREPSLARTFSGGWNRAWLLPVVAAFLIAVGLVTINREPGPREVAETTATAIPELSSSASDDQQLLQELAVEAPAMRASYEADLQNVNAYIHDAELSARQDPNDEETQHYLRNAYEERAMLYEMAMDRSLP